jgi:hypothetical protein
MNFPTPWSNVHLPSYNASGQLLSCRKKMRGNPYPVPPHFKIKRRNGCWFPSLYFSAIVTQCFNTPIDCSTKLNEFFRLGMNRRYRPLAMSLLMCSINVSLLPLLPNTRNFFHGNTSTSLQLQQCQESFPKPLRTAYCESCRSMTRQSGNPSRTEAPER